jgi:hypothetical protein
MGCQCQRISGNLRTDCLTLNKTYDVKMGIDAHFLRLDLFTVWELQPKVAAYIPAAVQKITARFLPLQPISLFA